MKLNYSTSTSLVSIHALVIHLLLLMNHLSAQQTLADDKISYDDPTAGEISKEHKDQLIKVLKRNILKTFGLKEEPKQPLGRKVVVPVQLLEEYRKFRDAAKQYIPNDSDYYGKIDFRAVEKRHADYYKSGIVVDMAEGTETGFLFKSGPIKQITELPLASDPDDVPAKFEYTLPPINKQQKQFISVHMKFNLSQDLNSIAVQELKGAELHLTRERLNNCEFDRCDIQPVPFSTSSTSEQTAGAEATITATSEQDNTNSTTNTTIDNTPPEDRAKVVRQRYQRVYLLHVLGYDKNNEPMTRIHDSIRIDVYQSTMLRFDIHKIVKEWLQEPTKRYGIIVRVTNDDEEYRELEKKIKYSSIGGETNASAQLFAKTYISSTVEDHVRLKRQFRLTSESIETWEHHLPRLFVFINPTPSNLATAGERYHVKREHLFSEAVTTDDSMQADQPTEDNRDDFITNRPIQADHITTSTKDSQQFSSDSDVQTSSVSPYNQQANDPPNRQKQSAGPYQNQELFNNSTTKRSSRAGVRASSTSASQKSRSRAKATRMVEKCSKRSLSINFDEVGWSSWIIAPQVYHTSYCYGDCSYPLSDQQNPSNHAIIQSIFHSVGRAVPRPCCVPTKLGNIAILYQLDGVVQMRHYDDMIIVECGCQ